jgi:hypothetical protein
MSLNYDLGGIENYKEVCFIEDELGSKLSVITEVLIFRCMAVGIGEITDRTIPEFWARMEAFDKLNGHPIYETGNDGKTKHRRITFEELKSHRGLTTNVFPQETRAKWIKRILGNRLDQEVRWAKNQLAKGEDDA